MGTKKRDSTDKEFEPSRAFTQVEPQTKGSMVEADRLTITVSVGKKPETKMVAPGEVEGLRPSAAEMKNG